jgi:pimeloyl-ACP methyl ester carboxylesterase
MAETRYAKSGDVHVAYQTFGEGPDLVFVPGWFSHVEMAWEVPPLARFLERLGSFSRVIMIDKRGTGLSDPMPRDRPPTLEQRMDDVRVVMDAVGSERAALLGISEGGPMSVLFAASFPERTAALVLFGTFARAYRTTDYPFGADADEVERFLGYLADQWGTGIGLTSLAPSLKDDASMRIAWGRYQRMAVSPGGAVALLRMNAALDVRHVLPAIRVPTLVLHRRADRFVPIAQGRHLAEHIPGARFVELDGGDHLFFAGDTDLMLAEIAELVTGARLGADPDRMLATVLFTDIVGSTERAAEVGDRAWRDLLDRHDLMARRQIARFRGRPLKSTGDGFLAVFDGPARAVRCAGAVTAGARQLGLEVRAGVHTGECELRGEDVAGIAVHIGARVAALAAPGEVLVSSTVRDLVAGSGLVFESPRTETLRGVPGQWTLCTARV